MAASKPPKKGKDVQTTKQAPAPAPTRKRSRTGYVMVELDAREREELERLRDRLEGQIGSRIGLAGAFRWLLRQAR
jgi:hypothetical protein